MLFRSAGALLRKKILLLPSHLRSFDHGGDDCTNQCDDISARTGSSLLLVQVPGADNEGDPAAPETPVRIQSSDHASRSPSDRAPASCSADP